MRHFLRLSFGALALAMSAACSNGADEPAVASDLEQDLARVGGADVQLAGSSGGRIDIVSASERTESPTPAPRAREVTRAPSPKRGVAAPARSPRRTTPAPAVAAPRAPEPAPAEIRVEEPEPEPRPAPQQRPRAPIPSTQPEPPGGWRTPGEIIRNAPFPINP